MRKKMSGEWSSIILTRSVREGLFAPAFCALIVRNVRIVVVGGATASGCLGLVLTWSFCGIVEMSPYVCPSVEGVALG